jgi:hypothetical protein
LSLRNEGVSKLSRLLDTKPNPIMSSSSQPEEALPSLTDAELAEMDFTLRFDNSDYESLGLTPTMGTGTMLEELQPIGTLSPQYCSTGGNSSALAEEQGDLTLSTGDPGHYPSAPAPVNMETQPSLQLPELPDVHIQILAARINFLESLLQQLNDTVGFHSLRLDFLEPSLQKNSQELEDLTTWSQSVDKHCQEQTVWCKDLDTHCRKQTARITELEFHSREQTTWSREIEKYNRDQNRVVLDLVGIVQKSTSGADGGSPASAATPGG